MPNSPATPDYRQTVRDAVVATAEALIARTLGIVEATHRFVGLAAELAALDDEDFLYFVGLDSQSDTFPIGPERQQWSAAALEREDLARRKYEEAVYGTAVLHCRNLIAKYSSAD
ncbi:MAG: hypothetical protein ACREVV_11095 [Steroidobacteraceae bacterium]